jgi:predicted small secreted protein
MSVKRLKTFLGVGLGLVAIGAVAYFSVVSYQNHKKDKAAKLLAQQKTLCTTDEIGKAISKEPDLLKQTKTDKLKPYAEKAKALTGYEHSPSCLYILTIYYVNTYQAAKAEAANKQLKAALKAGGTYGENLKYVVFTEANLDIIIKGTKVIQEQHKKNSILTPTDIPK